MDCDGFDKQPNIRPLSNALNLDGHSIEPTPNWRRLGEHTILTALFVPTVSEIASNNVASLNKSAAGEARARAARGTRRLHRPQRRRLTASSWRRAGPTTRPSRKVTTNVMSLLLSSLYMHSHTHTNTLRMDSCSRKDYFVDSLAIARNDQITKVPIPSIYVFIRIRN